MSATAAKERPTPCAHCGLPVALPGPRAADASLRAPPAEGAGGAGLDPSLGGELRFCCSGCETVYQVIHAAGFEAYYDLRDAEPKRPAATVARTFDELDDPDFLAHHASPRPDGALRVGLYLEGIHCSACLWLIEKALTRVPGVAEARLAFARGRLDLTYFPSEVALSRLARLLSGLGYVPHPVRGQRTRGEALETRRLLTRIGLSFAVAGNVMLMALALYGGWLSGMDPEHERLFRWASLLVTLPSILYAAAPFFHGALQGLRSGVLHMDLPISIGLLAGFLGGLYNTVRDQGEIYFDSVTALIFLLLVGRFLQLRQQRRAAESSELLYALTPAFARRLGPKGETQEVPLESIRPGDRLEVAPGELFPTDGAVLAGRSSADCSLLTGEPLPVTVGPGDPVHGGTKNLEAQLMMEARVEARSSRVGRIADRVAAAAEGRSPVVRLADRVAGWFVAVVLLLAVGTFSAWSVLDPGHALDHAVALLVVSCPCALGLATPLAITAAVGKAARRGILVRSGAALESLGRLRSGTVFFDKTGTLTHGRMELARFDGPAWVRPLVASAEQGTSHPVGRALRTALQDGDTEAPESVETTAGGGLVAQVGGRKIAVGSPAFVRSQALFDPRVDEDTEALVAEALTPVWVAVDGRVVALAGLADQVRPEAPACVAALTQRGFDVEILSGDHPAVAVAVGRQLGLSEHQSHGGLSPEDKLSRVEAALARGPVVMVGDGVNDAAALAAATVGVAVHGGAETCFMAADVFLQRPGVAPLLQLFEGARRTYGRIRGNILFSLGYNVVGVSLAAAGLLHPLAAALLMPVSSLVVVSGAFGFRFADQEPN